MATIQYIGDSGPDGTVIGKTATSLVGFFGATPVVRPSGAGQADILSTAACSISATQWGYATSAQADGIVTLLRALRTAIVGSGMAAGA